MKNLEHKWVPEVHHSVPKAPIIVVGTQVDLREDEGTRIKLAKRRQKPVLVEEGDRLAKKLGAYAYVECSALTKQGLKDVFDEAILAVLDPHDVKPEKKRRRCVILWERAPCHFKGRSVFPCVCVKKCTFLRACGWKLTSWLNYGWR